MTCCNSCKAAPFPLSWAKRTTKPCAPMYCPEIGLHFKSVKRMKKTLKTEEEKDAIVAEYLMGELSYRSLGKKHGIDFRIIHLWVNEFKGISMPKTKKQNVLKEQVVPSDIKTLQEELRKAKLHNELLNAMIDIAEDQLKISIRKKSGAKQLKK